MTGGQSLTAREQGDTKYVKRKGSPGKGRGEAAGREKGQGRAGQRAMVEGWATLVIYRIINYDN